MGQAANSGGILKEASHYVDTKASSGAVPTELQTPEESGSNRYDILSSLERSIHIVQSITARQSNRRRSHWNWSSGTSTTNNARHSGQ